MRKLNLSLEELEVESFATTPVEKPRGTVRGNDISDSTCYDHGCVCNTGGQVSCYGTCFQYTCARSCGGTCAETCPDTCKIGCDTETLQLSICNAPLSYCVCTPGGTCIE